MEKIEVFELVIDTDDESGVTAISFSRPTCNRK